MSTLYTLDGNRSVQHLQTSIVSGVVSPAAVLSVFKMSSRPTQTETIDLLHTVNTPVKESSLVTKHEKLNKCQF